MAKIAFLDIEVNVNSKKIESLGVLINEILPDHLNDAKISKNNLSNSDVKISQNNFSNDEFSLKSSSVNELKNAFLKFQPKFICGHNFVDFDKNHLSQIAFNAYFENTHIIDTLYLSMLLCPNITTHKLNKPYKNTQINIENNPLTDARLTKALFEELDSKFDALSADLRAIFVNLLYESEYFRGYFEFKNLKKKEVDIFAFLKDKFLCDKAKFDELLKEHKIELAFIISFLHSQRKAGFSPVILHRFSQIFRLCENLIFRLESVDLSSFAENEFNIKEFRKFESIAKEQGLFSQTQKSEISQYDIILSALKNESFLAILPTGGGKSFCFQLPALIKAKFLKSLTIVISPLQALMKNQVDGFKNKNQNFQVAAISGYLDPLSRAEILNQVSDGFVDILYLAPEALRSNSIFNALKRRVIERFVIDEAHCFSTWGHDFRHDYYFIADTIKELEKAEFQPKIQVSCFTATAKMEVIKDIKDYLKQNLNINALEFIASSERYNLKYQVISTQNEVQKFKNLERILAERFYDENGAKRHNPTIIYIPQNARACKEISKKLQEKANLADLIIEPFYARLDNDIMEGLRGENERNKAQILQDFIDDKIDIVIATTAFGMGIDKSNIMTIVHYEQSDSLESYMQESGRGARDEHLEAKCIVLYSKDEFNKKFMQLNRTKVEYEFINSVLKALKKAFKKDEIYISKKDIAKALNIDTLDSKSEYEIMIDTAILELEKCGIIKRGRNKTNIFATSITPKDEMPMEFIHKKLEPEKSRLNHFFISKIKKEINMYQVIILIMQNIIQTSKDRTIVDIEDLAEIIGFDKNVVFQAVLECQNLGFLDYENDISAFIKKDVIKEIQSFFELENRLFELFCENENLHTFDLREKITEFEIFKKGKNEQDKIQILKDIIQGWKWLSNLGEMEFNAYFKKYICYFEMKGFEKLKRLIKMRQKVCKFIINKLQIKLGDLKENELEFSSNKLKKDFDKENLREISINNFHHCLVFLHDMLQGFKIRKGRLIYYKAYKIEKIQNNGEFKINENRPYQKERDYNASLKPYYERKIEALHILIAFLEMILNEGYDKAKFLMKDYFSMAYEKFLKKHKFDEKMIKIPLTPEKYSEILQDLDENQKQIFNDKNSQSILVLAGPGSGKTKTLVHKIANLIMIEQKKPEYFLMLAHSRTAVAEFKKRIRKLVGDEIFNMKILTFHAFALYLLGEKIDYENELKDILQKATQGLKDNSLKLPKTQMLVIDEYQDLGEKSYEFIKEIYAKMSDNKQIIAVGDDDQCIKNFGNDSANIALIAKFEDDFKPLNEEFELQNDDKNTKRKSSFKKYFLLNNYRSSPKIVNLANKFRKNYIKSRLKNEQDLIAKSKKDGKISLIFYEKSNFIKNMIECVKHEISENVALLFRTNDEVLLAYSLLLANKINAKYIIEKDGFELGNLVELQDFLSFWQEKDLEFALAKFSEIYQQSENYKLAERVINSFLDENKEENKEENKNFYDANLFREFLKEIKFDDFEDFKAKVIVSTMHKAKGKEFDSVFIGVENKFCDKKSEDYDIRLLYVALTRAKINLQIHTQNAKLFDFLKPFCDEILSYKNEDEKPSEICLSMSLNDLWLEFKIAQKNIEITKPISGESVEILQENNDFFICKNKLKIGKFSASFRDKIQAKINENYHINKAQIEYVAFWTKKDFSKNPPKFKQILCRIFMLKA